MHNVVRTACIYALLGISPVYAADYITNYIPEAKLVGQGRAQFFVWDIYDAKFYAASGVYTEGKPFALELKYFQEVDGEKIADISVSEMRRLGYKNEIRLAEWHNRMKNLFPDVVSGSVLTGVYMPNRATVFYSNGVRLGAIDDPAFGAEFFRIWLDTRTSNPSLRQSLLNIDHDPKGYKDEMPSDTHNAGGHHAS